MAVKCSRCGKTAIQTRARHDPLRGHPALGAPAAPKGKLSGLRFFPAIILDENPPVRFDKPIFQAADKKQPCSRPGAVCGLMTMFGGMTLL